MLGSKFSEVLPAGFTLAYYREAIDFSLLGFTVYTPCAPHPESGDAIPGIEC